MTNLREKLALLLQDIEKMNPNDKLNAIERFMLEQFELRQAPHHIDLSAVVRINSRASQVMRDLPADFELGGKHLHREYPELCRAICFIQATYEYFREQKMTPYWVTFGPPNGKRV